MTSGSLVRQVSTTTPEVISRRLTHGARRFASVMARVIGPVVVASRSAASSDPRPWRCRAQARQAGRALTIEDYYRVQASPASADLAGRRWVLVLRHRRASKATTGTRSEAYLVPADASAPPRRIQHEAQGRDRRRLDADGRLRYTVDREAWTIDPANPVGGADQGCGQPADGGALAAGAAVRGAAQGRRRLPAQARVSPDGKWTIVLRDKPQPARRPRRSPTSSSATRSDFKARCSTGWSSSATASRSRRRT